MSPLTLELALNCLDACSQDEREPQRYRDWYAEAAAKLRAAATLVDPD